MGKPLFMYMRYMESKMIPYPRTYPLRSVKRITATEARINELNMMARELKNKQVMRDLKILEKIARGEV